MNENVNVCITPKGEKPVLHFSQFDNKNVFTVTVLADDGESAAVLTGLDIEFRLRKTDSHVVTIAPESVADNVITFKTTEQLCACCGQNIASVVLMKDDMIVSTLDILVDIQRDILSGGLTSESDIRNLTTQIEQIVPEVVGDDYYNKQEVDDLLAEHTFDPTNYYDKSVVDGLLADKADSDDVYTKTETDNLLSAKMNNIGYHGIVDDAAVISFTTDCKAPLDIIKGKITPVQSGSGTPSPQNVRPISGFSALNVTRTGKNLFDKNSITGPAYIDTDGTIRTTPGWYVSDYIPVAVGNYIASQYAERGSGVYLAVFDTNKNIVRTVEMSTGSENTTLVTIGANEAYIRMSVRITQIDTAQFENGNQATAYEPYNGQTATVNFGQTVYGGVLDVTNGKLKITHRIINLWDFNFSYNTGDATHHFVSNSAIPDSKNPSDSRTIANILCSQYDNSKSWVSAFGSAGNNGYIALAPSGLFGISDDRYTSPSDFKTALQTENAKLVYELATPIEITTTPETVLSIAGDNNIFLDTGNLTEIAYFEGAEGNLIKLIKACQI